MFFSITSYCIAQFISRLDQLKVAQPLQNDKNRQKYAFPDFLPNINIQSNNNIL